MRVSTKVFLGGCVLIVCLLIIAFSFTTTQVKGASTILAQATQASTTQSQNPGLPAIQPSLPLTATVRITSTDVLTYLSTHPFRGGSLVNGATSSTVTSLQFITSKQASDLMAGEETGLPDTAMVCYVKLQGPFELSAAHLPPQAQKLPIVDYVVEVFDAQTGNILMWWAPPA